jgi:glycosyltransferase involved in cell wall biosynthesis
VVTRAVAVIPAHNEALNLPSVIADVRASGVDLDVVVIDDGSRDGTTAVLDHLRVNWMRLPERMGVGCAVRAGLRSAVRGGYEVAVRMDGDGQHSADQIASVLAPVLDGTADVAIGSRYRERPDQSGRAHRLLARVLSRLTSASVTDPTSGFYAIGPRALHVLAEHHPTGYPEPELRLFLDRNGFRVVEVPVRSVPRLHGRTSLTAGRLTMAGARVALATIVVPLRTPIREASRG